MRIKSPGRYPMLTLKGALMGAADVVPGVSGGTIAFITGIYEELVNSIKSIDIAALKLLGKGHFGDFWSRINGNFLFSVVLGIAISIFSLAKLMTWLLATHTIPTWAFFFGLIVASSIVVAREIPRWSALTVLCMIAGTAAAYFITVTTPASTPDSWWFIILTGAIAVCAMILPGISGAFILLLMGKYRHMMDAVAELRVGTILLFVLGAIAGVVTFSHVLSWLLAKYKAATVATLTGFMIGSLNKVWPWKEVLSTYTDSHGALHPLMEKNISPGRFAELTGGDPQILWAVALCISGIALILTVEGVGRRLGQKKSA